MHSSLLGISKGKLKGRFFLAKSKNTRCIGCIWCVCLLMQVSTCQGDGPSNGALLTATPSQCGTSIVNDSVTLVFALVFVFVFVFVFAFEGN